MEVFKREKQMKLVDVIIENHLQCDKCQKKITGEEAYDAFEAEVKWIEGYHFPGSSSTKTRSIDLCQSCVKELFELLREKGYRINEENQ